MNKKIKNTYNELAKQTSLLNLNYYIGGNYLIENFTITELKEMFDYSRSLSFGQFRRNKDVEDFIMYTLKSSYNNDKGILDQLEESTLKECLLKEIEYSKNELERLKIENDPQNKKLIALFKEFDEIEKKKNKLKIDILSFNSKNLKGSLIKKELLKYKAKFKFSTY